MATMTTNFSSGALLQNSYDSLSSVYSLTHALEWAQAAYDNLHYYSPSYLSTYNSSYIKGRLKNGDDFQLWGSNLTSYPQTITEMNYVFNYYGAATNRVKFQGAITQANATSDETGTINKVDVWSNNWGQVSITGSDNVAVAGDSKITAVSFYNTGWGMGGGVALHLHGDIVASTSIVNGYYQASISGKYTSATLIYNDPKTMASNDFRLDISGFSIDANTNFASVTDILKIALAGNDTITGGSGVPIDGFAGIDTVTYSGNQGTITHNSNGTWTVGTDTLTNIERLQFADTAVGLDINGNAGQVYRLYQAAFNRTPDKGGLGDWIYGMDHGMSLLDVSAGFIGSNEFKTVYGQNPTDSEVVTRFYENVLHRAPEQAGYDYWMNQLQSNLQTRTQVLTGFSESPENQAQVIGVIQNGIEYTPHLV